MNKIWFLLWYKGKYWIIFYEIKWKKSSQFECICFLKMLAWELKFGLVNRWDMVGIVHSCRQKCLYIFMLYVLDQIQLYVLNNGLYDIDSYIFLTVVLVRGSILINFFYLFFHVDILLNIWLLEFELHLSENFSIFKINYCKVVKFSSVLGKGNALL